MLKTTGALQKSTQVMQSVQALVKIPEVAATMRELSKEMMKAGILEEMVNDTFESLEDQEELEEAADEEIDNVCTLIFGSNLLSYEVSLSFNNNGLPRFYGKLLRVRLGRRLQRGAKRCLSPHPQQPKRTPKTRRKSRGCRVDWRHSEARPVLLTNQFFFIEKTCCTCANIRV